jgi:hypothetical protein
LQFFSSQMNCSAIVLIRRSSSSDLKSKENRFWNKHFIEPLQTHRTTMSSSRRWGNDICEKTVSDYRITSHCHGPNSRRSNSLIVYKISSKWTS